MSHKHTFEEAQKEELEFWNTPGAELGEQLKQLTYARFLGLDFYHDGSSPFVINKEGLSIIDVGGGPVSLLLKTHADLKIVVDPCDYPKWVDDRYKANGTDWFKLPGEDLTNIVPLVDEVWMYNVLQHTKDPEKIFNNIYKCLKKGGKLRFMDWVDTPTNVAHPISLTPMKLGAMLHESGFKKETLKTTELNENGAVGKAAYGVFTK